MINNLDIKYSGDMTNRYICFDADENSSDFREKMICHNKIAGFLNMSIRNEEGKRKYYYDISGQTSLREYLAEKNADKDLLYFILNEFQDIFLKGKGYMLEENDYCIHPDTIYFSEDNTINVCYLPGYQTDIHYQLEGMLGYMMDRIDVSKQENVYSIYIIYSALKDSNCTFSSLISMLEKEPKSINAIENSFINKGNVSKKVQKKENGSNELIIPDKEPLKEKKKDNIFTERKKDKPPGKKSDNENNLLIAVSMAGLFFLVVLYFLFV